MARKKGTKGKGAAGKEADVVTGAEPATAAGTDAIDRLAADDAVRAELPGRRSAPRFPAYLPPLRGQLSFALLAGFLLGIAHPFVIKAYGAHPVDPSGLTGLLVFVGLVPLFFCIRETTIKRAFWLTFAALIVKYLIVFWWLTVAMNVFGHIPLPIAILLVMLLGATVAAPYAGVMAGCRFLAERFGYPFWILAPSAFAGAELVRNYGFLGGFPWGVDGYALAPLPTFIQLASIIGIYGLTTVLFFINAGLTEGVVAWREKRALPRAPLTVAAALFGVIVVVGVYRMNDAPEDGPDVKTLKVALLQGNIEQGIKNDERLNRRLILDRYHALQGEAVAKGAELVVWPEAAVPTALPALAETLANTSVVARDGPHDGVMPPAGIIGSTAREWVVETDGDGNQKKRAKRYNTVFATEQGLKVKGRFDKIHLVPFGEYVPWPFNSLVKHLVPGLTTPGEAFKPATINTPQGPVTVGATVCYEGAFPEITLAYTKQGAELMFNVTNDAWYGISSMTWQHTYMYALRAVESGRPIARAANTGVSAWVDTRGRVHDVSNMYETSVVMADVPLVHVDTWYATLRDTVPFLGIVGILALFFYALCGLRFWERDRHPVEWLVGVAGLLLAAWTVLSHWFIAPPGNDDALSTQNQIQGVLAILIGCGALSGRPWGRWAQWGAFGAVSILGVVGLIVVGSSDGVVPMLVTGALALIAFVRKHAYQRPPAPPVAGPYALGDD
jgi:apolipoprotein N-acyltransferase